MIKATVHVHKMQLKRDNKTGAIRPHAGPARGMDFTVESEGAATDTLRQARKAFAEKYGMPLANVSANFEADPSLSSIHLIYRE